MKEEHHEFGRMTQSRRKVMQLKKEHITKKTIKQRVVALIGLTTILCIVIFALVGMVMPLWVAAIATITVALLNIVPALKKILKMRNDMRTIEEIDR